MASRRFSKGVTSLVLFSSLASPSFAGGLERGGYNIDQLFDTSPFSFQSGVTYVTPQRRLKDVRDTNTSVLTGGGNLNSRPNTADDTSNYTIPYIGFRPVLAMQSTAWSTIPSPSADIPTPVSTGPAPTITLRQRLKPATMAAPVPIVLMSALGSFASSAALSIRKSKASRNVWFPRFRFSSVPATASAASILKIAAGAGAPVSLTRSRNMRCARASFITAASSTIT